MNAILFVYSALAILVGVLAGNWVLAGLGILLFVVTLWARSRPRWGYLPIGAALLLGCASIFMLTTSIGPAYANTRAWMDNLGEGTEPAVAQVCRRFYGNETRPRETPVGTDDYVFPNGQIWICEEPGPGYLVDPVAISPTVIPTPPVVNPPGSGSVGVTGHCDVLAVTSLPIREDAMVNNTVVTLQVRDTDNCGRPLWYNETGVNRGANFQMNLTEGWCAVTASVSAEVHEEGGTAQQFTGGPVVVITGPWNGSVGLFEGAVRVYPCEWLDNALNGEVLPIQRVQVGDPGLMPIYIGADPNP